MNTATALESFYSEGYASQELWVAQGGDSYTDELELVAKDDYLSVSPDMQADLGHRMQQLDASIEPVTVKVREAGELRSYTYEIAYLEQGDGDDTELRASSYSSSLTLNPGNITEVAEWSQFNPGRSYAYAASPGNGLTSPLAADERKYLRRYGNLFAKDGLVSTPMPFIRGLHLALQERGISVTRLGSDSAGALVTTAYGSLPEVRGDIRTVHQNVRTNVEDRPVLPMITGMLYTESRKNGPFHTKTTQDPLSIPKWDEFVREQITGQYEEKGYKPKKSVAMLRANLVGLGRGPKAGDPLVMDNITVLRNNPDANVLFTNGREDPLVDPSTIDERMRSICRTLSRHTNGRVLAATIDGASHGPHTFYPQYVQALSRATLG